MKIAKQKLLITVAQFFVAKSPNEHGVQNYGADNMHAQVCVCVRVCVWRGTINTQSMVAYSGPDPDWGGRNSEETSPRLRN